MQNIMITQSQCYYWQGADLRLELYIQSRASKDSLIGRYGERFKVTITAAPIDGKANRQLIKFLAKYFAVPKNQVRIISGMHSHFKSVLVYNPSQNICNYPK